MLTDRWQNDGSLYDSWLTGLLFVAVVLHLHTFLASHSKCQNYDILNASFKKVKVNTSEGYGTQLPILGRLSDDQIYLFEI